VEARDWWLANRDKAPNAFYEELDALVDRLATHASFVGQRVSQDLTVRRVFLPRIRYYVYFQVVDDGERVEVLAIWHGSRGDLPSF